jgi:hypothetical protein
VRSGTSECGFFSVGMVTEERTSCCVSSGNRPPSHRGHRWHPPGNARLVVCKYTSGSANPPGGVDVETSRVAAADDPAAGALWPHAPPTRATPTDTGDHAPLWIPRRPGVKSMWGPDALNPAVAVPRLPSVSTGPRPPRLP